MKLIVFMHKQLWIVNFQNNFSFLVLNLLYRKSNVFWFFEWNIKDNFYFNFDFIVKHI